MNNDVAELCEPEILQSSLERYAAAAGRGYAAVAFAARQSIATASVHGSSDRRVPIGCLAKLLTATLVAAGAARGRYAFDASVGDLLGTDSGALRAVTVRHLLEHTHGLDDSLLRAPRFVRRFVDRRELLKRAAALERWAVPGEAYSYGNGGAWLLAALLERSYARPFAALAHDALLAPCGIERSRAEAGFCAALGTGLTLTAEELVRVSLYAFERYGAAIAGPITPLPGWHPLERGVCRGWKAGGAGWFGHQSVWPGASIYLRVQPEAGLALAVVATEQPAALVALGVFGGCFAELFDGRACWPPHARAPLSPGVYAQAAQAVAVTHTPRGACVEAWRRGASAGRQRSARTHATLAPVGGVHFARPPNELVPYLEAIPGSRDADWLWNGRVVLRRARGQAEDATRR